MAEFVCYSTVRHHYQRSNESRERNPHATERWLEHFSASIRVLKGLSVIDAQLFDGILGTSADSEEA